jgi:hypothetical protein
MFDRKRSKIMHWKFYSKGRGVLGAFVLCASLAWACSTANADTATFEPSKDNTLVEDANGELSNGTGPYFFVGNTNRDVSLRGVFAFNLQGIPAGSTITGVTLTLNMSRTISGAETLSLHRLLQNWGEGTSNSVAGTGITATTGDATWIHTFFATQSWTNAGGDFAATASASLPVEAENLYTWGSTAGMVADVQGWIDNPSGNFGWILMGNETATATAKRFDSRENSVQANRPKLTVTYTLPSSAALSGTLTLQGIAPNAPAQPITFLLQPSDNSGDILRTANVAPNGTFQLTNVPRKNYSIRIKGNRYLAARVNGINASGGDVSGMTALLRTGDGNNDNAADITDLLALIAHYNQVSPAAGYLEAVDFNLDGANDITDLLLLIGNYNQLGAN